MIPPTSPRPSSACGHVEGGRGRVTSAPASFDQRLACSNPDAPAFPVEMVCLKPDSGLTKREYFAIRMAQAWRSLDRLGADLSPSNVVAFHAVADADALIEELNSTKGGNREG